MDKHSREYQINCMKESLENKPMKKVNHFKMKKIKKIWVFSYAVTTIFGVNAIMNHLPSVHNSVAYADEASSQYTPGRYYYQENPVFISGGTIGVGMQIRVPNSLGKTIKSVTFSNGSGQKTISSFSAPIQDSLSNSYTISSNEAPLTNSPTSQAQHSYLNNPMTIMYSDGTTFTTSMGTSDVIREMETYVRRLQSQISSLTNFDDSYKSRADAAYVAKANELANSYEVNLIYPENGGVITPDFPDEAVLDAMSTDRKNQNTWFGELSVAATDKTNELNTITDAVPGGIEEANQKVTDYLTQAKGEVFAAEGSAVDSTGQEWVNKIKGIDVERVTTTPATPTINQPTEGDQEVTGTGQPGDTIVITDKGGSQLGTGTVGEDGSIKIETNRPLEKGEVITVTPSIGDKEGTPTTVTVLPKDEGTGGGEVATPATPIINQPTEGDQEVTGTGQPGDTIVITDKGGSQLGTGTVGEDGSIKIETNRPLEKGEVITVTPSIGDKEGTPTTVTVLPKDEDTGGGEVATPATPTINQPTEGDQEVTGTGQPGDNIVITDKDGIVIGEGTVGENGSIKIETNRPLEKGEVITVTPSTNGKKGTPTSVTVLPKNESESGESDNMNVQDPQNPAANQSTGGSQVVTGMKAAKNNGTARQSITSKNLPKTGEEIFQTTSILGVLIALLSGGIFLVRKKEQQ